MEKYRPGITLKEAIKEAQEAREIFAIEDPHERAAAIADWVRREYPFAWTLDAMGDAAAQAVGVPSQRELAREYREIEAEEEREALAIEERREWAKEETVRVGLSLIGGGALCLMGDMVPGAVGLFVLGLVAIAWAETLDNPDDAAIMGATSQEKGETNWETEQTSS